MAKIQLSLHADYQPDWGVAEALRELVANALDAEASGHPPAQFEHSGNTLRIRSPKVRLSREHLLLGKSENRAHQSAIGQFGEGLKLGLLVLAREAKKYAISTKITNDDETWTPALEPSDTFGGAEVLTISTRALQSPRGYFEVAIDGINAEFWEGMKGMFLALHPCVAAVTEGIRVRPGMRVFLDPALKGKLYNKGVFVTNDPKARFGYELDMELNRDRQFYDRYAALYAIATAMRTVFEKEAVNSDARRKKWLTEIGKAVAEGDACTEVEAATTYEGIAREVLGKQFDDEYGSDAIPVTDLAQARELALVGKRAVIVSPAMARVLGRQDEVNSAAKEAANATTRTYQAHELTADDLAALDWASEHAFALVEEAYPENAMRRPSIQIVDFASPDLFGLYHAEHKTVQLAHRMLEDRSRLVVVLLHEVLHAVTGSPDSAEFERQNNELLVGLVRRLLA